MVSPKLKKGVILIDPAKVKGKECFASTIKGTFKFGMKRQNFPKPDLVVEGSVTVNVYRHRLGKGHGSSNLEIQILKIIFGKLS